MTKLITTFIGVLTISILIVLGGCPLINDPAAPVIVSVEANPRVVNAGEVAELEVQATDANGDGLTYTWSAPSGKFNTNVGHKVSWTAPLKAGDVDIEVKVSDGIEIVTGKVTVSVRELHREPPSNFLASGLDGRIQLFWSNPSSTHFAKVVIRRSDGGFPNDPADGRPVYEGSNENYTDPGLTNDTLYYYSIFAKYRDDGFSEKVTQQATPVKELVIPNTPSGLRVVSATAGSVSLSWYSVRDAAEYSLRRDGAEIYTGSGTSYTDTAGLANGSEYNYQVSAGNTAGWSSWSLVVKGRTEVQAPTIPEGLSVAGSTDTEISLTWNSVAGAAEYELRRDGLVVYRGSAASFTDSKLTTDTRYAYDVRASNSAGKSAWSTQVYGRTSVTPPRTPTGLAVTDEGADTISLNWNTVLGAEYELRRDGNRVYSGSATTFSDTGLSSDTQYAYDIRAVNSAGESAWSSQVFGQTVLPTLDRPSGLQVVSTTTTSVSLAWNEVTGADSYELRRNGSVLNQVISGSSFTDSGLDSNSDYVYAVRAKNSAGVSPWTTDVPGRTALGIPSVPEGLEVTGTTTDSVSLSWDSVNGADSYEVSRDGVALGQTVSGTSFTDTGQASGREYSYAIRAKNAAGVSAWSVSERGTTLLPADLLLDNFRVSKSSVGLSESITIYVTVRNSGGVNSDSTQIKYYRSSDAAITSSDSVVSTGNVEAINPSGSTDKTMVINAPSTAGTYYYGAIVGTVTGEINTSNNTSTGVRVDVNKHAVTGSFSYNRISIHKGSSDSADPVWSGNPGGQRVEYSISESTSGVSIDRSTGRVTVSSSAGIMSRSFMVTATGTGDYSGTKTASIYVEVQYPTINDSPTLRITGKSSSSISLSWNSVSHAESYELQRNGSTIDTVNGTSYTDSGRSGNTEYTYKVRGVNPGGTGPWSSSKVERTEYPNVSGKPSLQTTGQTSSSISLSWNSVSNAKEYELRRNRSVIYTGLDRSFTDTGLSSNTSYTYDVRGVNPDDNGDWSNDKSVKTKYPNIDNRPSLSSTGRTTSSISLSWDAISGAESYELKRNGSTIYTESSKSYTDSGLSSGTEYTYKIRGVNPDYNGPWSSDVKVSAEAYMIVDMLFELTDANEPGGDDTAELVIEVRENDENGKLVWKWGQTNLAENKNTGWVEAKTNARRLWITVTDIDVFDHDTTSGYVTIEDSYYTYAYFHKYNVIGNGPDGKFSIAIQRVN